MRFRMILTCITGILVSIALIQALYYIAHPLRADFDAHYICSIDGHAYLAYAEDGHNDDKTLSRVKDADHVCTDK